MSNNTINITILDEFRLEFRKGLNWAVIIHVIDNVDEELIGSLHHSDEESYNKSIKSLIKELNKGEKK